ncbi:MAG: hypothetical protein AB2A00_22090 [Myxococcota bacterium]
MQQRHPRLGFKTCILPVLTQRARDAPWSRIALLMCLGIPALVQRAPFGE